MSKDWFILTGKRRSLRSVLLIALVIGLQILLTSKPALAHITLIRTDPADGEVLATAPGELQLQFSEPVPLNFSSVQLLNEQGQPLPGASLRVDPAEPTVLHVVMPTLKTGGYTLLWKTLSGSDGHFSHGFTAFRVGKNGSAPFSPSSATATSFSTLPPLVAGGLRWANFLLLASIVGALAIAQWALTSEKGQAAEPVVVARRALRSRLLRWAAGSAAGAWLVGLGLLIQQVADGQDASFSFANWLAQAWLMLTQTEWGVLWLIRQGLLLFVGGGLWWLVSRRQAPTTNWPFLVIAGRAVDLLILQALSSHVLTGSPNWFLALINETVHLFAASLWMGGLIGFVVVSLPIIQRGMPQLRGWQAIDWRAFSLLAVVSVGLLVTTGLLSMSHQVASLDALITTVYGRLLLGKLSIVLLAGLCGLLNTLLVHPRLGAWLAHRLGRPEGWTPLPIAQLPRLIMLEAVLGVLIFGLTGWLTASPPPRDVEFTLDPANLTRSLGQRVNDLFIVLDVAPNRPGQNVFSVRIAHPPESAPIYQVLVRFTASDQNETPVAVLADEVGPGLYQLTGKYLKLAGPWQVDVVTTRNGVGDTVAHFDWVVAPMGAVQPVVWSKHPLSASLRWAAGCCALLLVLGLAGWRWRAGQPPLRLAVSRDERSVGAEATVQTPIYHS